eukprot:SAG11_NODE_18288_length_495_cov_1.027778_1_plen_70_part_00
MRRRLRQLHHQLVAPVQSVAVAVVAAAGSYSITQAGHGDRAREFSEQYLIGARHLLVALHDDAAVSMLL